MVDEVKSPLEVAADKFLADSGYVDAPTPDDVLCGSARDMEAILNGPAWLSRLVSHRLRVSVP